MNYTDEVVYKLEHNKISKRFLKIVLEGLVILSVLFVLTGCADNKDVLFDEMADDDFITGSITDSFDTSSENNDELSLENETDDSHDRQENLVSSLEAQEDLLLSKKLAVSDDDYQSESVDKSLADKITAPNAILVDITDNVPVISKNIYESIYPASTTKLLTAYTALSEMDSDNTVSVFADNGNVTRAGAKLCGFKKGDSMSLITLVTSMLIYSGNDAAEDIAYAVGGSEADFISLMNEKAAKMGATHTHFVNPHGLHESAHHTTAFDMYIILNSCINGINDFESIVERSSYTAEYSNSEGKESTLVFENTNEFLTGAAKVPDGVTVVGGKTGSTPYAGDCLIQLIECNGKRYIAGIFGASSQEDLYTQMTVLLEIAKDE